MTFNTGAPRYRRDDHQAIAALISEGDRVLDVGCGDGSLMEILRDERRAHCRGLEISQQGVNLCVAKGLSVVQGNAGADLPVYPDNAFDYAVLSKAIQEMDQPTVILSELSRIARRVIVSFRNYGHWKCRMSLLFSGRTPRPGNSAPWYADSARRPCTVLDMTDLAKALDLKILSYHCLPPLVRLPGGPGWINLFGDEVILVLESQKQA